MCVKFLMLRAAEFHVCKRQASGQPHHGFLSPFQGDLGDQHAEQVKIVRRRNITDHPDGEW